MEEDKEEKDEDPAVWRPNLAHAPVASSGRTLRPRALEGEGRQKKEKRADFYVSLSQDEIYEDVLVMTGSKPRRGVNLRPRQRLHAPFPGLSLPRIITPKQYGVSNSLS